MENIVLEASAAKAIRNLDQKQFRETINQFGLAMDEAIRNKDKAKALAIIEEIRKLVIAQQQELLQIVAKNTTKREGLLNIADMISVVANKISLILSILVPYVGMASISDDEGFVKMMKGWLHIVIVYGITFLEYRISHMLRKKITSPQQLKDTVEIMMSKFLNYLDDVEKEIRKNGFKNIKAVDRSAFEATSVFDEIVTEATYFKETKDKYYNIAQFEDGKSKIAIVTGMMGSGKTTLANKLVAAKRCDHICLDMAQGYWMDIFMKHKKDKEPFPKDSNEWPCSPTGLKLFLEFIDRYLNDTYMAYNREVNYYYIKSGPTIEFWTMIVTEFIDFLKKKKLKNPIVVEGIQIVWAKAFWDDLSEMPVIIKETPALTALNRMAHRNAGESALAAIYAFYSLENVFYYTGAVRDINSLESYLTRHGAELELR